MIYFIGQMTGAAGDEGRVWPHLRTSSALSAKVRTGPKLCQCMHVFVGIGVMIRVRPHMPVVCSTHTKLHNHTHQADLHDIDVFSAHREPERSWTWRNGPAEMAPRLVEGPPVGNSVAIKLSITDHISDDRILAAMPSTTPSIWEITCASPRLDVLQTRDDMSQFRKVVRTTLNRINEVHGVNAEVSVFPAAPAAACIEFGRCWQPKAHRPMEIYDQVSGKGFVSRLRIE